MLPWAAFLTGFIGAFVYYGASKLLLKLQIDDPLDAFAVHGACGFWGVLAVGWFGHYDYLSFGWDGKNGDVAGKAHYGSGGAGAVYERVMEFCETKEEAEKIAQGLFDSFSLRYFTGEVDCLGCAEIVPGCVVELMGFGKRVSGVVMVTEVSHHISSAAGQPYTTSFKFCSNAAGPAQTA